MIDNLSIVIPALNEEESIPTLLEEIEQEFMGLEIKFEIVLLMTLVQNHSKVF